MTVRPSIRPAGRALILDDDPMLRDDLAGVVTATFPDLVVTAVAGVGAARAWLDGVQDKDERSGKDGGPLRLAVIDLGLPDGSGIDIIRAAKAAQPEAVVIVATIFDDDTHLFDAIAAGADGYLVKDADIASLGRYLQRIHDGEPPLSPSVARRMMAHFRALAPPATPAAAAGETPITAREAEVLGLLGRGLRTIDVARMLGLSEHTVSSHVKSIYAKLNISCRAEAALEAARRGLC